MQTAHRWKRVVEIVFNKGPLMIDKLEHSYTAEILMLAV